MQKDVDDYKRAFFDSSIADILRAIDGGSLIGAYTLTFCSIAALSEIYLSGDFKYVEVDDSKTWFGNLLAHCPSLIRDCFSREIQQKHTVGKTYKNWIRKWFKKAGVAKPPEFALYAIRCSLVHTYGESSDFKREGIKGYELDSGNPDVHFTKKDRENSSKPITVLNLETFVSQFIVAAFYFFDELKELDGNEKDVLLKRLSPLIYVLEDGSHNHIEAPKEYKKMHSALSSLDSGKIDQKVIESAIKLLLK